MLANMERGTSATGVAYQREGSIRIKKAEGPADKFLEAIGDSLPMIAQSPRGLIHARATTKGSEHQNENNHPVAGFNWAVVHNGALTNDDDVWSYYTKKDQVKRFAEVDTSAIPLVLGRGKSLEESIRNLSILGGSLTVAAWSSRDIERMVLARFGYNELFMFYDQGAEIMYWSSASSASYIMQGRTFGRHKFLAFSKLADEHVLVLQPGGFSGTRVFKVTRRPFFLPRASRTHTVAEAMAMGASGATTKPDTALFGPPKVSIKPHRITTEMPVNAQTQRKFTVEWMEMESSAGKPHPMHEHFTHTWMSLWRSNAEAGLKSVGLEICVGYGRWNWKDENGTLVRSFKPYKRTKDWWNKEYRTYFALPLTQGTDHRTELDEHCAWEHYDLNVQLLDNSTRRFLGFMCPICGIWTSAVALQHDKGRCEYCNVASRIYPKGTQKTSGIGENRHVVAE